MKRFLAIVTAAVLCLALIPPAYAETTETKDPVPQSITRPEPALAQGIIRSEEDIPAALPAPAPVQPTANVASGTCGSSLNWTLSGTGVLTITGTGAMRFPVDEENIPVPPWEDYSDRIVRVVLPEGITSIDTYAFAECYRLTTINLPDSITSIAGSAFYDCIALSGHLELPDHLTSVEMYTFCNCANLTGVTLPEGLESIGEYAFAGCINLSDVTFPESLRTIFQFAFAYCVSLTEVSLSENFGYLQGSAFAGCSGIREVKISNNATYGTDGKAIYRRSEEGYGQLVAWVAQANTTYEIPYQIWSINYGAFSLAENLTSVKIPESVSEIEAEAFAGCVSLTGVKLPDELRVLGSHCFDSSGLTSITIPANVQTFNGGAFHACYDLAVLRVDSANQYFTTDGRSLLSKDKKVLHNYCTPGIGGTYRAPSEVSSVSGKAFADSFVENVIFSQIKDIGDYAFASCPYLRSVSMDAPEGGGYSIGEYAFYNCVNLAYIMIPEGMMSIKSCAFAGCTSLTGVTLPRTLQQYLNSFAFYGCTSLTSMYIPNRLWSIDEGVFYGCDHLNVIAFGDVAPGSIDQNAFYEITADMYYPSSFSYSWTENMRQQFGGHLTWKSYTAYTYTPLRFTGLPADVIQAVGTTATFSVTATGAGLKYQWQSLSGDGEWANTTLSGAKTAKLSVPVTTARDGTYYRCVVTDSKGTQMISSYAKLAVRYTGWRQEDGKWHYRVNGEDAVGWKEE